MRKIIYNIFFLTILIPLILIALYTAYAYINNFPKQRVVTENLKENCLKVYPYKLHNHVSVCDTVEELKKNFAEVKEIHRQRVYRPNDMYDLRYSIRKKGEYIRPIFYYLVRFYYNLFPFASPTLDFKYQAQQNLNTDYPINTIEEGSDKSFAIDNIEVRLNKDLDWPSLRIRSNLRIKNREFDFEKFYSDFVELNGLPDAIIDYKNNLSKSCYRLSKSCSKQAYNACWGENCTYEIRVNYDLLDETTFYQDEDFYKKEKPIEELVWCRDKVSGGRIGGCMYLRYGILENDNGTIEHNISNKYYKPR